MENKKSAKFDIDIEIKDLLWEFLRRWRLIVVLAIVCGVGLAAYQYRADLQKTDVKIVKKTQAELEKAMGEQDLDEVSGAVALKNQLDQKSAYMDASVLMKINPYQEHVVLLQYYIDSDMELVAEDATEAYVAYVQDGYLAQAVADNGAYDIEPVYMTELINTAMDMGGLYVNTGNASQNIKISDLIQDTALPGSSVVRGGAVHADATFVACVAANRGSARYQSGLKAASCRLYGARHAGGSRSNHNKIKVQLFSFIFNAFYLGALT